MNNRHLFLREDGSIQTDEYVSRTFHKDILRHEELTTVTFHQLRHSCASWLLANGVDLFTIKEILGHSTIEITSKIYAHIDQKQKRAALDKLKIL